MGETLAGCTGSIGEGVWGVSERDKLNVSFSQGHRGGIIAGVLGGGGGR